MDSTSDFGSEGSSSSLDRATNNYNMKFKLKTKLVEWLRKCANRIEHKSSCYDCIQFPNSPLEPIMLECNVKRIDTLAVQKKIRLFPEDRLEAIEKDYIYPEIAHNIANELVKSGFLEIRRVHMSERREVCWEGKLHVVRI